MKWKKTIGWLLAGCLALLLIAVVGGYLYLRSNNFRQYALRKIVEQADLATGARTEIGGLDFSLSTLTAHLYNITLRGSEATGNPPLLQADELTVRIKIVSALHRQVSLRELLIVHPVVHLEVGKDGKNNLPTAPPSQNNSNTNIFDLAVQHAASHQVEKSTTTTKRSQSKQISTILAQTFVLFRSSKPTRELSRTITGTCVMPNTRLFHIA